MPRLQHSANRPEQSLLLICARAELDESQREDLLQQLQRGLDWDRLTVEAEYHGLRPLVAYHLGRNAENILPPHIHEENRRYLSDNLRRNLYLSGELLRLIERLEEKKLRALPYKGPALAELLFGNLALRQVNDLDVLLRRENALAAAELLRGAGFAPVSAITDHYKEELLENGCDFEYVRSDGLLLDLHWAIVPRYYSRHLNLEKFWSRIAPQSLAGKTVEQLAAEDLLVVLCLHGSKHRWYRLVWLADIAALVRRFPNLDWGEALATARQAGALREVLVSLRLASTLLQAPLPNVVEKSLRADPDVFRVADRVRNSLIGSDPHSFKWDGFWFSYAVRERWSDRAKFAFRHLFTPTPADWKMVRLPPWAQAGYVPLRVARLTGSMFRMAARTLFSRR